MGPNVITSAVGGNSCVQPQTNSKNPQRISDNLSRFDQSKELTKQQQQQLTELKRRDREVRAHEQAHIGAGGQYIRGGANYEYQVGPDGRRYAVGGEVSIDTSEVPNNPAATIQKMQVVRRAALAPANPSGQDRAVAADAAQKEVQARQELIAEKKNSYKQNSNPINNMKNVTLTGYNSKGKTINIAGNQQAEGLLFNTTVGLNL